MVFNELEIIYRDELLVAVNKPSGLLVHRTHLAPKETQFAVQILRDQVGCYVYPTHRLDNGTSGVLLFTMDQDMAKVMGRMVLEHDFNKTYLALVRGWMPEDGIIDYPIPQGRYRELKDAVSHFSRSIITEIPYAVGPFETARYSLICVYPKSGRRHQIRRHVKHLRYPIVGDKLYGDRQHNALFRDVFKLRQMFLHAYSLEFIHPVRNQTVKITANIPEHWRQMLSIVFPQLSDPEDPENWSV